MQEAFRRAAAESSNSELKKAVNQVSKNINAERRAIRLERKRKNELDELAETMRQVGGAWKLSQALPRDTSDKYLEAVRKAWQEKSLGENLQASSDDEAVMLLSSFSKGAGLYKKPLPIEYRLRLLNDIGYDNPLNFVKGLFGPRLPIETELMMKAFGDILSLDSGRREELSSFMTDGFDKKGKVDFQDTLPRMASWLKSNS